MPLLRHTIKFGRNTLCLINQIRCLNLQEYQSKQLLLSNGCVVQNFFVVDDQKSKKLDSIFKECGYSEYVVKAQILAGGRGKGHFRDGRINQSGVFITRSTDKAKESICDMIGKRLVTNQTGPDGVLVNKVMVAESVSIKRETYLSVFLDPTSNGPVIVACPMGGIDIEEVAKEKPELLLKKSISIMDGVSSEECWKIAEFLGFQGSLARKAAEQIEKLYNLLIKVDATQIEINPFAETEDGCVFCIDAKLNFDDNALFRQKNIFEMEAIDETDIREIRAKELGLNYIGLNGNIACMVNGAGLAMATMDIIKLHGGLPANFLDVGGSASEKQVYEAFKIIVTDPSQLRVIFVNIFGGIMQCDIIARGVIKACSELDIKIPVVMRLEGTNMEKAKELIQESSHLGNFHFHMLDSFEEAAKRVVELGRNEKQFVQRI